MTRHGLVQDYVVKSDSVIDYIKVRDEQTKTIFKRQRNKFNNMKNMHDFLFTKM